MGRKAESNATGVGRLRHVAQAVKRFFSRHDDASGKETRNAETRPRQEIPSTPRVTRREADIPMNVLEQSYTPPLTSSKASFRSDGADHHKDQEFASGAGENRWNDEDQFTNKSGDPRIGTHRRTYEPGETRDESRD